MSPLISFKRDLRAASDTEFDLIVVGAGIHGVQLALEASRRGIRTLLLERDDFGRATSASSLRILHGGLRYLQNFDAPRYRESVRERSWMLEQFPDLVEPLGFLFPLDGRGVHRPFAFRAALALNDLFSRDRNDRLESRTKIENGSVLNLSEAASRSPVPLPTERFTGAALWYDGLVPDHVRLVAEILRWAVQDGCVVLNHMEAGPLIVEKGRVLGVRARDRTDDTDLEFRGARVVNCAGPWCPGMANQWQENTASSLHPPSIAFNLVFRGKLRNELGLGIKTDRGRSFFLWSRHDRIHVGTEHLPWTEPIDHPAVGDDKLDRFFEDLIRALPDLPVTLDDLLAVEAGYLTAKSAGSPDMPDRERIVDHRERGGPSGAVSSHGIKYTTAHAVAERTLALVWPTVSGAGTLPSIRTSTRPEARQRLRLEQLRDQLNDDPERTTSQLLEWMEDESAVYLDDLLVGRIDGAEDRGLLCEVADRFLSRSPWSDSRRDSELDRVRRIASGQRP